MFGLSIFKADDDLWSYGSCLLGQYVSLWLTDVNLGGSDILDDWCNWNYPTFSTYPHMIPLLPSRQALLMRHFSIFFMPSIMFVYVWAIDARLVGDYKYMCCVLKSPNGRPLWLSLEEHNASMWDTIHHVLLFNYLLLYDGWLKHRQKCWVDLRGLIVAVDYVLASHLLRLAFWYGIGCRDFIIYVYVYITLQNIWVACERRME
jgi:hypothetical protein